MMDAARDHGFKEGFVVPFHYRDRLGAIHSSSTVFFWEDEPRWFDKLFTCHRHELHLLMIPGCSGRWTSSTATSATRPRSCGPPTMPLRSSSTAREREVMAWAARGKTVADTAQILGISPETVEGFIKQALRKLGCVKQDPWRRRIALGIIDL